VSKMTQSWLKLVSKFQGPKGIMDVVNFVDTVDVVVARNDVLGRATPT